MKETFGRRLWAAALTGITFAACKMGFGWYEFHHAYPVIGVAAMIWFGRVPLSPQWAADVWNTAVIGNVLSVGLEQLYRAIGKR